MWVNFKDGNTSYRARINKVYKKKGIFFKKEVFEGYFIEIEEMDYDNCYGYSQIFNDRLYRSHDLVWRIGYGEDTKFKECLIDMALEKIHEKRREYERRLKEMNRTNLIVNE